MCLLLNPYPDSQQTMNLLKDTWSSPASILRRIALVINSPLKTKSVNCSASRVMNTYDGVGFVL